MRKSIVNTLCVAVGMAIAVNSFAAKPAGACSRVKWVEGQFFEVNASVHSYTHIILPEPIQGLPMYGSPELWDVKGENIHLFIKPYNYGNKEGGRTSVTVISDTNHSYDFIVNRVPASHATPCVLMVGEYAGNKLSNGWARPEDKQSDVLLSRINQLQGQLEQVSINGQQQALDALDKYRSNIYTGYTWEGGSSFFSADNIKDVYDDGRFTIIRLNSDNKGMMQLKASINGSDELVEYDYNADQKIYTVAGLYPELILSYDDTKIVIKRKQD